MKHLITPETAIEAEAWWRGYRDAREHGMRINLYALTNSTLAERYDAGNRAGEFMRAEALQRQARGACA